MLHKNFCLTKRVVEAFAHVVDKLTIATRLEGTYDNPIVEGKLHFCYAPEKKYT